MTPAERQSQIAEQVNSRGVATVEELAQEFDVSPETVRRDLTRLARAGRVVKTHGRALRLHAPAEGSFEERLNQDAPAKRIIAEKLIAEIQPGNTIFMDTGSTTLACAGRLADFTDLTVVTNSLRIAQVLATGKMAVHLLGGRVVGDNAETVGPDVIEQVGRFRADVAVLSVTALDELGGMDASLDEAHVARAMRDNADRCIIVAHSAKFGRSAPHRICRLDQIDVLVCDAGPEATVEVPLAAALKSGGVALR